MSHLKLGALRYIKPNLDFNDENDVCDLINFLDHKYFHLGFSHDLGNVMELDDHLKHYISELGLNVVGETRLQIIDALLNAAVSRNLREKLIGNAVDSLQAANQLRLAKVLTSLSEEDRQALNQIVFSKVSELKMVSHPSPQRMAMALLSFDDEPTPEGSTAFELADVPSGVKSAGGSKVDDALKVLRMINVYRFRNLQTQVNEHLAAIQEITADPKADTKIGRVGY